MIRSMTGFGRAKNEVNDRIYTVEIKAVNHKYTDISIKGPRFFSHLEDKIRKKISTVISRGKIDIFIGFENYSDKGVNIKFNTNLAKAYIDELMNLSEITGIENRINSLDILRLPEVLKIEEDNETDTIETELMSTVDMALNKFIEMKQIEGEKLVSDMKNRIVEISNKVKEISEYSAGLVEEYVVKLESRIKELLKTDVVDETRLAQEIVIYSDKCSIEEELTRLNSHIIQFQKLLESDSPVGKKIDFLIQEMNRETNTIGSKANCLEITNRVILIKTEIENIREQVQNIE